MTVVRADHRLVEVIMNPKLHGIGYKKGRELLQELDAGPELFEYLEQLRRGRDGQEEPTQEMRMKTHLRHVLTNGIGETPVMRLLVANSLLGPLGLSPLELSRRGTPVEFIGAPGSLRLQEELEKNHGLLDDVWFDRWTKASPRLAAFLMELFDELYLAEVAGESRKEGETATEANETQQGLAA